MVNNINLTVNFFKSQLICVYTVFLAQQEKSETAYKRNKYKMGHMVQAGSNRYKMGHMVQAGSNRYKMGHMVQAGSNRYKMGHMVQAGT